MPTQELRSWKSFVSRKSSHILSSLPPREAEYRQVGKSGLRVSVPILGGMTFGSPKWSPWVLPPDQALLVLKAAWDVGINTIDTANLYSNGDSERILGQFMKTYSIPRRNLVIMTKALCLVSPDPSVITIYYPNLANTRDYANHGGLSRTALFYQVQESLERIGTTYVDVLQIHAFEPRTPIEETMRALNDLVISGKVRYLGACNIRAWQLAEMNSVAKLNKWTEFTSVQIEHSLLYRPEELDVFQYCLYKGLGIFSYSPLMDGHLARRYGIETSRTRSIRGSPVEKPLRQIDKRIIKRVEKVALKRGWSMAQVALGWSASKVTSPIVGANTPERVGEVVTTGLTLSKEDTQFLEALYVFQARRF